MAVSSFLLAAALTGTFASLPEREDTCWVDESAAIDAYVATLDTTAVMVLKDGVPIYRAGDIARTEGLYVASVRKSLLALLYGPWVENGTIDLDKTLEELGIDDNEGLSDAEKQATIRHLITSRSGIYHPASNGGDSEDKPARGSKAPGEYFLYNNWDFNAAGAVFEQLTGKSIYQAFDAQIAEPLGLEDYDADNLDEMRARLRPSPASRYKPYHFTLSARDLARVGQMVAQNGEWHGTQVISTDWVEEMLTPHTTLEEVNNLRRAPFAYGYMWWLVEGAEAPPALRGGAMAQGAFGQYILANQRHGLAAAHLTEPRDDDGESNSTSARNFAGIIQRAYRAYRKCGARDVGWEV